MSSIKIEDKLAVDKFDVDKEVHIRIREDICKDCREHPCVHVCPSDCFNLKDEGILFSYEGCLECGSCRIVCPKEAIEWALPRAGFGVCYQYG